MKSAGGMPARPFIFLIPVDGKTLHVRAWDGRWDIRAGELGVFPASIVYELGDLWASLEPYAFVPTRNQLEEAIRLGGVRRSVVARYAAEPVIVRCGPWMLEVLNIYLGTLRRGDNVANRAFFEGELVAEVLGALCSVFVEEATTDLEADLAFQASLQRVERAVLGETGLAVEAMLDLPVRPRIAHRWAPTKLAPEDSGSSSWPGTCWTGPRPSPTT
jgi:hypothetical protein